jgi:hypothetical protein
MTDLVMGYSFLSLTDGLPAAMRRARGLRMACKGLRTRNDFLLHVTKSQIARSRHLVEVADNKR